MPTFFWSGISTPIIRAMDKPLALPLFVAWIGTNHAHHTLALYNFAALTQSLYGWFYFHFVFSYFCRNVIRPLLKSYGLISTMTLSPGNKRMKCNRILPEIDRKSTRLNSSHVS